MTIEMFFPNGHNAECRCPECLSFSEQDRRETLTNVLVHYNKLSEQAKQMADLVKSLPPGARISYDELSKQLKPSSGTAAGLDALSGTKGES